MDDGTYSVEGMSSCLDTDLIISSSYNGDSVSAIGAKNGGTFYGKKAIKSAYLFEGITSIGNAVFYDCTNLEKVVLPEEKIRKNKRLSGCRRKDFGK